MGCRGDKYSLELYAKGVDRKFKPEFVSLVAGAMAAIVFSVTKDDTTDRRLALPQAHGTFARRQG